MKVLVVGAGCIGSVFGALLAEAGHEVSVVARGARQVELQRNGLRVRRRRSREVRCHDLRVLDSIVDDTEAELILVAVQQHQLEGLLPALARHPAATVVLALNYSRSQDPLVEALGDRLVWAFPAMLAEMDHGVVDHVVLPRALGFVQITTIGAGPRTPAATVRGAGRLLAEAGIAHRGEADMPAWLLSHAALMAPIMAAGVASLRVSDEVRVDLTTARLVAAGQREGFAAIRASGHRVVPRNLAVLGCLPRSAVSVGVWSGLALPPGRRALRGHADHGAGEVVQMMDDLIELCARSGCPNPALRALRASL